MPETLHILHSNKKLRYIVLIFIVLSLLILLLFILRNTILNIVTDKKLDEFRREYHLEIKIESLKFSGLSGISLNNAVIIPEKGDTLLKFGNATARFNFWKALTGRISLDNYSMSDVYVVFFRNDSTDNYLFLLNNYQPDSAQIANDIHVKPDEDDPQISDKVNRIMTLIFNILPAKMQLTNVNICADINHHCFSFHIDKFEIEDHNFSSVLNVSEMDKVSKWYYRGSINRNERNCEIFLASADSQKIVLPYLGEKWDLHISFDSLDFKFRAGDIKNDLINLSGLASVHGLTVNHPRIASDDVILSNSSVSYHINIGQDKLELDSASAITLNSITLHPWIEYKPFPEAQLHVRLNKPDFPADDLFGSLPSGFFNNLAGIRTQGELSFKLDFFIDMQQPDSVKLQSELKRHNFRIIKYGNTDFSVLNDTFSYTAYEKGIPVRTFFIGPPNREFRTLDRISDYLKDAVIISEDGGFYNHRGFISDAIKESIAENVKKKRFARGGSTISMQLVKNVFLSRNKTVARKLEEMLIVWLIENNGICSKDRMYEVYLNIIEWGPLIYGANEASEYYFNKDAMQLDLNEAIFLASIIPRPKWFRYSFNGEGHLRDYLANYFRLVSSKMLRKEMIEQEEYDNLLFDVTLTGKAKELLKITDTIPADSLRDWELLRTTE